MTLANQAKVSFANLVGLLKVSRVAHAASTVGCFQYMVVVNSRHTTANILLSATILL